MTKSFVSFICLIATSFLLFTSCNDNRFVYELTDTNENTWSYQDTMSYDFEITDTNEIFDISMFIRVNEQYGFSNIYVMTYTEFPNGFLLEQRVNLPLAEPSGKWFGDCSSDICLIEIPIQQNAYFNQLGTYTFKTTQIMRKESLNGVLSVGLGLTKKGDL